MTFTEVRKVFLQGFGEKGILLCMAPLSQLAKSQLIIYTTRLVHPPRARDRHRRPPYF